MKRFIFIPILALALLSACSTTKEGGRTYNILPLDIEREDFNIVAEDNYQETMKTIVEPYLDSIRHIGTLSALRDGHRIYYEYFDIEEEKGSVVILHGFTEFIRKYSEIIYYFSQAGYDVYMIEHYGHGYSERRSDVQDNLSKVAVDDFDVYTEDVKQFVDQVVLPKAKDNPLILFGHSMGGGVATRFLEIYPDIFSYAILSSPMIGIEMGAVPEFVAKFLSS